jgi:hypothetical protein
MMMLSFSLFFSLGLCGVVDSHIISFFFSKTAKKFSLLSFLLWSRNFVCFNGYTHTQRERERERERERREL